MYVQSVVAIGIFYATVCRGSDIKAEDANRLNQQMRKDGWSIGMNLISPTSMEWYSMDSSHEIL